MARWYGYSLEKTRGLLLTEFWMLDAFLARHPPVDLLAAAWLGFKAPGETVGAKNIVDAKRMNSEVLNSLPPRRNVKTLAQMPAFLRTPDQLKWIEGLKKQWQTS